MAKRYPDRLRIELNALATRVVFDDRNRAIGVEYQKGERLYAAHPGASTGGAETRMASARREVILAGGAFNTPQLLMLSGIGDPDVLAQVRHPRARAAATASDATCRIATKCRSSIG